MPAARLPENEAELGKLYTSVLNGKRALLFLFDNAANTQQIAGLIPPAGCLLLVTSRQHLSLAGMFASRLDSLPAAESPGIVAAIVTASGRSGRAVGWLCGHLPLALLRLAASALTEPGTRR